MDVDRGRNCLLLVESDSFLTETLSVIAFELSTVHGKFQNNSTIYLGLEKRKEELNLLELLLFWTGTIWVIAPEKRREIFLSSKSTESHLFNPNFEIFISSILVKIFYFHFFNQRGPDFELTSFICKISKIPFLTVVDQWSTWMR